MYPAILLKTSGMDFLLSNNKDVPKIDGFESRLLALPIYSYVSEKNIKKTKSYNGKYSTVKLRVL